MGITRITGAQTPGVRNTENPNMTTSKLQIPPMPDAVAELIKLQGEMSDVEFCREYNWPYSEATYSRVRRWSDTRETIEVDGETVPNPDYGKLFYKGKTENIINAVDGMLRRVRERRAVAQKTRGGTQWIEFTPAKTILDRISILHELDTQNRLLMYLTEPGGGKTALAREIAARYSAILIEAKESWRNSYKFALTDICLASGVELEGNSTQVMETGLIKMLKARKRVLVIDEGEYFGPKSLNLLKLILNQTPTIIVLMAIPVMWTRVQSRAWAEAQQLTRRTDHVERVSLVHPDEVKRFMLAAGVNLNGTADQSAALVAKHANEFGRFDLVKRVAERLADGEPKPLHEVELAATTIKVMIGFLPGGVR